MKKTFTKTFDADGRFRELPDGDYWLAREEHILSYLWQRGAAVPRVNFKDNTNKKLVLEDVGQSLDVFFKQLIHQNSQRHIVSLFFEKLLLSVQALEDIFDLGVLHLDVALRNLTMTETQPNKVFVIDFSHALIRGSRTQKPIPLVPVEKLHHPRLVQALIDDWNTFLSFSGQPSLSAPYNLNISKESFARFWSDELTIQDLSATRAILCHGIGNLFFESSSYELLTGAQSDLLKVLGGTLRNQSESDAQHALVGVKREIREFLGDKAHADSDKTVIPKLSNSSDRTNVPSAALKEVPAPEGRQLSGKTSDIVTPLLIEIAAWLLVAGQIWWVNFAIEVSRTRLSDSVLTWLISGTLISLLALVRSAFVRPNQRIKARMQAVLCILSTQGLVVLSMPTSKVNFISLWVPILAGSVLCLLIYLWLLAAPIGKKA